MSRLRTFLLRLVGPPLLSSHLTHLLNGRKVLPRERLKEPPLDRKGPTRALLFVLNLVPDLAKEREIGEERGGPGMNALNGGLHLEMRTLITCLLLLLSLSEILRIESLFE